jgi:hypothetical protein
MKPADPLAKWFPPLGQCLICGVPGVDQRHRVLDAILDMVAGGETVEDVAEEMGRSVEAVAAAVRFWRLEG